MKCLTLIALWHPAGPVTRARQALAAAILATLAACVLGPAAALGATIDFESPSVADGTAVTSQFAAHGVTFVSTDRLTVPRLREGPQARSGLRAVDISTNAAEFPVPGARGDFSRKRSRVTAYVRNITAGGPFTAHLTLRLFDAAGNVVASSNGGAPVLVSSATDDYTAVSASSPSRDVARFELTSSAQLDQGQVVLLDDLEFDEPSAAPADFLLRGATAAVLRQGHEMSVALEIARLNGSAGAVAFTAENLPTGVTARVSPNPATSDSVTLTLAADASAPVIAGHPISIVGQPQSATVGPGARRTNVAVTVDGSTAVLDDARITQGLERDLYANVDYRMIAGKDTLARARLYGDGSRTVTSASCAVRHDGTSFSLPAQYSGPGDPRLNATRGEAAVFNCWIPGARLDASGNYEFSITIRLAGNPDPQTLTLGTRTLRPTRDVSLLIYPWIFPERATDGGRDPEHRLYDADVDRAIQAAVRQLNRLWPVRSGVGPVNLDGRSANRNGIHVLQMPPLQCTTPRPRTEPAHACAARVRGLADLNIWMLNRQSRALTSADGRPRDQFDLGAELAVTPRAGGGAACASNSRTGGAGVDTLQPSHNGVLLAQEMSHCLGQVSPTSPNKLPTDPAHSAHQRLWGQTLVNTLERTDWPNPRSVMFPSTGPDDAQAVIEGYEYNAIHDVLMRSASPQARVASSAGPSPAARSLYVLAGTLTKGGRMDLSYAARVDGPGTITRPSGKGYTLSFLDRFGRTLARTHFGAHFAPQHDGTDATVPFLIAQPLPAEAAALTVRRGSRTLLQREFPRRRPKVTDVRTSATASGVRVRWKARGPGLRFSVRIRRPGAPDVTVATGLHGRRHLIPAASSFAGQRVRIVVEAADGLHVVARAGKAIRMPRRFAS